MHVIDSAPSSSAVADHLPDREEPDPATPWEADILGAVSVADPRVCAMQVAYEAGEFPEVLPTIPDDQHLTPSD